MQLMEQLAQVGTGLGLGRVRPKQEREMRASLGGAALEHQIRKERLQAWDCEGSHRCVASDEQEIAQQLDAQGRNQQQPSSVASASPPHSRYRTEDAYTKPHSNV